MTPEEIRDESRGLKVTVCLDSDDFNQTPLYRKAIAKVFNKLSECFISQQPTKQTLVWTEMSGKKVM